MTTGTPQRSVLLIGASQRVLDEALAVLRDLGYTPAPWCSTLTAASRR